MPKNYFNKLPRLGHKPLKNIRMTDFKKGQSVWIRPIDGSNAARGGAKITKTKVVKVGRKFIYTEQEKKFHKDSLRQDGRGYAPDYELFPTEQASIDYDNHLVKWRQLTTFFERGFGGPKLTYEQTKFILNYINPNP